jgi:hypothetical protein
VSTASAGVGEGPIANLADRGEPIKGSWWVTRGHDIFAAINVVRTLPTSSRSVSSNKITSSTADWGRSSRVVA